MQYETSSFKEDHISQIPVFHREYPYSEEFVPQPVAQLPAGQIDIRMENT